MSYTAFNEEILILVILGACPPFSNAKDTATSHGNKYKVDHSGSA
jgi:hypothetical protein